MTEPENSSIRRSKFGEQRTMAGLQSQMEEKSRGRSMVEAARMPVLETNIYAGPSPGIQSLRERDIAPFHYLAETIKLDQFTPNLAHQMPGLKR